MPLQDWPLRIAKLSRALVSITQATLSGGGVANGSRGILQENVDPILKGRMFDLYEEVKETAQEFNMRGNLDAGATIRGFVTVSIF
jgi:hypothetical protein